MREKGSRHTHKIRTTGYNNMQSEAVSLITSDRRPKKEEPLVQHRRARRAWRLLGGSK